MIDEKKIELMKKLQRLAERGVGGEKEGAQKKLQQLMKKYNIEESDLSDDKLEDHEWKYHNDFELRLLKQTIYKVMGKDGLNQMYHYRSGKGKKTIQGVQCTKAQAIQIGIEYEFYCETWKEEHDFFFKCFVQKHKIFPTKEEMIIRPQDDAEMSDEDAMRMQMAMSAMKDKSMTQRIEGYDCKNACWDSVPYGSTTATMFGGCDKEDEMTEEEAERFGETEDCPFWENRYKEENA